MAEKKAKKIKLLVQFEGSEGEEDIQKDHLFFHPSTDVGTAQAIIRSHFTNKNLSRKKKGGSFLKREKEVKNNTMCECMAMWGYDALEIDELSFKEGDVIKVFGKPDENWWKGELNGKKGLFPSIYVQEVIQEEVESNLLAVHDPGLYGLYAPSPLDVWLESSRELKSYDLEGVEMLIYKPLSLDETPTINTQLDEDSLAAAQRRDDIETALRLFASSGADNITLKVFVRDVNHMCSLEISDSVFAKDVLAMLAKQLKGKYLPGLQQVNLWDNPYN